MATPLERGGFRANRSLPPPIAGINAAGLLAVVAALIVTFMLWTPTHEPTPALPAASNASIQSEPSWGNLFTIGVDGAVQVDRRAVGERELDERIRAGCQPSMRFSGSDDAIYIEADPDHPYSAVLGILEWCRAYGGSRAVFLTKRNISLLEIWASGDVPTPTEWRRAVEEQRGRSLSWD